MKRLIKKIITFSLTASCLVFGLTLTGCSTPPTDKPTIQYKDVYSFASVTATQMLDNITPTSPSSLREALTDEQLVDSLNKYMGIFEGIVGNEKPTASEITESDKEGYAFKMTTTLTNLIGETETYEFYYNETVPSEDNRPVDDDDDEKTETQLEGIMTIGETEYALTGEKTVEEDEIEISMTARIDENNKVEFAQETEDGEQEFAYKIYQNGELVDEMSLEIEIENDETEIEIFTKTDGEVTSYKIAKDAEEDAFQIEYADGDKKGNIKVTVEEKDGKTVYKYVVDDDGEFEKDRD